MPPITSVRSSPCGARSVFGNNAFAALSVYLTVDVLHFSVQRFAWISLLLGGVWLTLAVAIGRRYHDLEQKNEKLGA